MDHFSPLLPQFGFRATVFFRGDFCGANDFRAIDGHGQLHLVRRGRIRMTHSDLPPVLVDTPSLVLYPKPFDHRLTVDPGEPAELLCANLAFRRQDQNPILAALPQVLQIPLASMKGLGSALLLLFEESAGENAMGRNFILDRLCDVLVVHVIRHAFASGHIKHGTLAGLSDPQLALALQAVHAEPGRPWPLEEMAKRAGLSRTRFVNRFREVVGKTPADYVLNWRLDLAENYLNEGRSVKEVAHTVGYANQPAFTRAFAGRHGMPPTEWIKQANQACPVVAAAV